MISDSKKLKDKLLEFYHDSSMGGHSCAYATTRRLSYVVYTGKDCLS